MLRRDQDHEHATRKASQDLSSHVLVGLGVHSVVLRLSAKIVPRPCQAFKGTWSGCWESGSEWFLLAMAKAGKKKQNTFSVALQRARARH